MLLDAAKYWLQIPLTKIRPSKRSTPAKKVNDHKKGHELVQANFNELAPIVDEQVGDSKFR